MVETSPIPHGPEPVRGPAQDLLRPTLDPGRGAAFRVLLDGLEEQSRRLQDASGEVERPEQLAGAVERARESLEEALTVGDRLLEAYRAAQQRTESGPTGG